MKHYEPHFRESPALQIKCINYKTLWIPCSVTGKATFNKEHDSQGTDILPRNILIAPSPLYAVTRGTHQYMCVCEKTH
jgi:hypothetical protein